MTARGKYPKRYLSSGAATHSIVERVEQPGTPDDDGLTSWTVYTSWPGDPIPRADTRYTVQGVPGEYVHVTSTNGDSHQYLDGIARRVLPGARFIGADRAWGTLDQLTRAYVIDPRRLCTEDDRCGRKHGHAGVHDWI